MTTKTKMNKEFFKNKILYLMISDFEYFDFKKGDIFCLFDKELAYTEEHNRIEEKFIPKGNSKRLSDGYTDITIKNYYYTYHFVDVNSGELFILDEDEYSNLQCHADGYIDITKDK
tara:strand:+ start:70 stop:417 length:348 start_codon:yes stop_codon:yes gene_type:complete